MRVDNHRFRLPENEDGCVRYSMTPSVMAGLMAGIIRKHPNVRIIGGCYGTTPEHIREMRRVVDGLPIRCQVA